MEHTLNKAAILKKFNDLCKDTLMETLGIEYVDVAPETGTLVATMPVDSRVYQPMRILHGGATVALAESVGSAASQLLIDPSKEAAVGAEISANHLKSARTGMLIATATCLHKGKSSHLFQIRVENEQGELISMVKLLNFIKARK
ncbi:MAG: PaaI family thioesterase [Flavobacteriales bacterium]|nr:PaaI family thioesterase [Flavobacteriales bacterium]